MAKWVDATPQHKKFDVSDEEWESMREFVYSKDSYWDTWNPFYAVEDLLNNPNDPVAIRTIMRLTLRQLSRLGDRPHWNMWEHLVVQRKAVEELEGT